MSEKVLSLQNVVKRFGGLTAVDTVSFDIHEGEIYGLIGPNGAGKTTIFNMITGVYDITEGDILYKGESLKGKEPHEVANTGITRTFQNIRLFKELTAVENVLIAYHGSANYSFLDTIFRTKNFRTHEKELLEKTEELLELMGLTAYRDVVSSNLPYGLQRKLEIARALAVEPKLLLLDEPAAGMNPEETQSLMELIKHIRDIKDLTVLVIEHHMDLIMGVSDKIFVLNFGKPLAEGTPSEIQNNPEVVKAYLGEEEKEGA